MKDTIFRVPYSYRVFMQPNSNPSYYTLRNAVFHIRAQKQPTYIALHKIAMRILDAMPKKPGEKEFDSLLILTPGFLQVGDIEPQDVLNYDDEQIEGI